MSAVTVPSIGKAKALDGRAAPDEVVTEENVQDPKKLSELLVRLLRDVASLKRRFSPRRIDFEDVAVGGAGATVSLQHNFGGRVRWWIVDWSDASGTRSNIYRDTTLTTANTLVLVSLVVGIATIRVEETG